MVCSLSLILERAGSVAYVPLLSQKVDATLSSFPFYRIEALDHMFIKVQWFDSLSLDQINSFSLYCEQWKG